MRTTEHPEITVVAGGGPEDAVTVRYLRLAGTDREIGRDLAQAARAVHGSAAGPTLAPDPTVQRVRRRWFAQHHPVLAERMLGVAD
ncbi:MAG: hypothetical protein ABWZ90_03985, partial [Acidimicrobiales bacterium]